MLQVSSIGLIHHCRVLYAVRIYKPIIIILSYIIILLVYRDCHPGNVSALHIKGSHKYDMSKMDYGIIKIYPHLYLMSSMCSDQWFAEIVRL